MLNPRSRRQSYPLLIASRTRLLLPLTIASPLGNGAPLLMNKETRTKLLRRREVMDGLAYIVVLTP